MTDILQEQIAYYRSRAQEYNQWWYRQGRYDRGDENNQQWFEEVDKLQAILHSVPPQKHILELAAGAGIWTRELVKIGQHVTAVDASPEMLAINKAEVASNAVTYLQADVFDWIPDEPYDMVFFSFWLSHVPPDRLKSFLQNISGMLKPDGYLFLIDSQRVIESTATDHIIPDEGVTLERKLNDGRTFCIVKVFYRPDELEIALLEAGIQADVSTTRKFFIYAQGQKQ